MSHRETSMGASAKNAPYRWEQVASEPVLASLVDSNWSATWLKGETDGQVERLEQVFASIAESPKGKTCDAIMGILEAGKEIMDEYKGASALDAGLLAAAQAVEHYEISRYGTLKTWAAELGYKDAVKLLDATLKEEKATDSTLSQIAESEVNQHAEPSKAA
jgi:ferritin-like metal-binding protein YciE